MKSGSIHNIGLPARFALKFIPYKEELTEVIYTCGQLLHGKAGKHELDVKKGLNVIDKVIVENLRKARENYEKCTDPQNVGLCGSKADAQVWLEQALVEYIEAFRKDCPK